MERKRSLCKSGAEQNKGAGPRTLRTNSDFSIGKSRKSLPEFATVRTEQRDIDARDQRSLLVTLDNCVHGKRMRPKLLQRAGIDGA